MRIEEAAWLGEQLASCLGRDAPSAAPQPPLTVLNIGSSTGHFRRVAQPHIDSLLLRPLREAGCRLVHADLKADAGVDIAGDLFEDSTQQRMRAAQPAAILFCNILEHLQADARARVPAVLDAILPAGGLLAISAPCSYPYHADPIDTMYRPTPQEILALFPGYEAVRSAIVQSQTYGEEFRRGSPLRRLRKLLRVLFPFVRPRRWASHAHRFLWLRRPYRLTCVVLRKPEA